MPTSFEYTENRPKPWLLANIAADYSIPHKSHATELVAISVLLHLEAWVRRRGEPIRKQKATLEMTWAAEVASIISVTYSIGQTKIISTSSVLVTVNPTRPTYISATFQPN